MIDVRDTLPARAPARDNRNGTSIRPLLVVEDLTIAFGELVVLKGLTFHVDRGDSLAILGPNGCGKTVLFKALVGSLAFRGRIQWAPGVRIGYVPQKLDLERDLPITGFDLLSAKRRVVESDEDVDVLVRRVGLDGEVRKPIGALSGGQLQRLLVALALVGKPDVLLLDEFTAGVDAPGQGRLSELVRMLRVEHGLTVLSISHDLSVVYRSATSVLIPAVTAKRLAHGLTEMMGYAVGVAVVATVTGTYVAHRVHRPTGPIIIAAAAALFVVSLVKRRR